MNSLFTNASHNRIERNLIGTAADGTSPLGNGSHGIAIWLGNHDNIVGGRDPAARNTIAFNGGAGVLYGGSNSRHRSSATQSTPMAVWVLTVGLLA